MRAKMRLNTITLDSNGGKRLSFSAVTDDGTPENERYHRYTPSGSLELYVDNPPATEGMEPGGFYFLDFVKAES